MTIIDPEDLVVNVRGYLDPSTKHTSEGRATYKHFEATGFVFGMPVGILRIDRKLVPPPREGLTSAYDERLNFWFDLNGKQQIPRNIVVWQEIYEPFRRQGLAGELLLRTNSVVRGMFGTPLYSSGGTNDRSQRVWEKLVGGGLAEKITNTGRGRWRMVA